MNFLSKTILKILRKGQQSILSQHRITGVKIGDYCDFKFYENLKNIHFGKAVTIRNYCHFLVSSNAELIIENNVFFNNFCSINSLDKIFIGENTLFGEGVKLYDHNHQYQSNPNFRIEHQKFNTAPIHIGKNCWLGSHVIVLKGVTIGDNCVIGAGCVIYKDVPANSIIVNQQDHKIKSI